MYFNVIQKLQNLVYECFLLIFYAAYCISEWLNRQRLHVRFVLVSFEKNNPEVKVGKKGLTTLLNASNSAVASQWAGRAAPTLFH